MTSEIADRRKHRRYRVDNSLSTSTNGIFQIIDLSLGGFSFKCPPYSAIADLWDTDILTPMTQLKDFLVKRVWVLMPENGTHDLLPMVVGVRFGKLNKENKETLSILLQAISQNPVLKQ